jgi:hypothetical protein
LQKDKFAEILVVGNQNSFFSSRNFQNFTVNHCRCAFGNPFHIAPFCPKEFYMLFSIAAPAMNFIFTGSVNGHTFMSIQVLYEKKPRQHAGESRFKATQPRRF